jgi:Ca-activated chloride channel homolog
MRFLTLVLISFLSVAGNGQVVASVKSYDFGDLYNGSQTYVDIVFTNKTDKTHFLLTIDKPEDVYYIFSGKKMLPDSSITIRMKVNDAVKGKFSYAVDVYFSDSNNPTTIYLEGTIKEVSQNSLTQCPDFNHSNGSGPLEFTVIVKVIDSLTRQPIANSKVYMVERGELVGQFSTNNKGIVQRSMPLGYYFITAEKEPYQPNFFEGYVNTNRNYVEIELSQTPVEFVQEFDTTELVSLPEVVDLSIDEPIDTIDEPEVVAVVEPVVIPPLADLPDSVFDAGYFKYNNITFVLDASSSMNGLGKLDLLKMSMIELVKILRPEDNITVLKYAAEVDMILEHTPGDKKDEIIQVIKGIKTSGSTAGGDAIKTAYALNREKHMYEGNNLIIMITDGLFNKGAMDYEAVIASNYQEHGTRFSVVGIKTTSYISEHMQDIVKLGGGDFVEIHTVQDAQTKLIEEIKRTSYKGS